MADPRRTPWIAVDVDIRKDDRISDLPSDAARWGYVAGVLAEARLQNPRGVFGSQATFEEAVGRFARHLNAYLEVGLMERAPNLCDRCLRAHGELKRGALVVHNWGRKQSDPTAAERQRRHREQANGVPPRHADVTPLSRESHGNVTGASRARAETQTQTPDTRGSTGTGIRPRATPPAAPTEPLDPLLGVELDDPRYPVAHVLATRYRYRAITEPQWERMHELVDNEYPSGTRRGADRHAAWRWLADLMANLGRDDGDPIAAALTEVNRRIAERLGQADQRTEATA